jgi:hypothetical protein
MHGISRVASKRVQVGVGRGVCSIVSSYPKRKRNARLGGSRAPRIKICHIPDIIGIRSRWRDATDLKAEFRLPTAGRGGREAPSANKFHRIVLKMRQAQTFLATFENDHWHHENVGRYFSSGAAHDFGRGLYGPIAHQRAKGGATRELTLAVRAGVRSEPWGTTNAFH